MIDFRQWGYSTNKNPRQIFNSCAETLARRCDRSGLSRAKTRPEPPANIRTLVRGRGCDCGLPSLCGVAPTSALRVSCPRRLSSFGQELAQRVGALLPTCWRSTQRSGSSLMCRLNNVIDGHCEPIEHPAPPFPGLRSGSDAGLLLYRVNIKRAARASSTVAPIATGLRVLDAQIAALAAPSENRMANGTI
jgi:hypothetical protein